MQKSLYKRFMRIGPGGIRCVCCGPAPGKTRKAAKRQAKRAENQIARKEDYNNA